MKIRIQAGYPATDGSLPETLDVEIEVELLPADMIVLAAGVIDALAAVPSRRSPSFTPADFVPQDRRGVSAACARTLCGHGRNVHSAVDDQGQDVGVGNGACSACGNADKCRSFVGQFTKAGVMS